MKNEKISDINVSKMHATIILSPLELLSKFGIIPWTLIIDIALVILTTCQIILIESELTTYTRLQEHLFYNLFLENSIKTGNSFNRNVYLYTLAELKNHVNETYQNYLALENNTIDQIQMSEYNPYVEFIYYQNHRYYDSLIDTKKETLYQLNSTSLGPFENESLGLFLSDVLLFRINYTILTYKPYMLEDNLECVKWEILQKYNFIQRSHFTVNLEITNDPCVLETISMSIFDYFIDKLLWMHMLVLTLGIVSMRIGLNYITQFAAHYMKAKQKDSDSEALSVHTKSTDSLYYNPLLQKEKGATTLPITAITEKHPSKFMQIAQKDKEKDFGDMKDKYNKFQFWTVICLLGNMIQIFGSCVAIAYPDNILEVESVLVGLGCFFAYLNIVRYIEFNSEFSIFYAVVRTSFPVVMRFLAGVFPIFLGYLFFGICVFWRSERFATVSSSMYTLFALIQGDAVADTFQDLKGRNFMIGQIYCYTFCMLFLFVVWNIFISLIEDSYVVSKLRNKTSWVYEYVKLEPKLIDIKLHSRKTLQEKDEFFKRGSLKGNSLKSFDALNNMRSKFQQSFKDETYKGAKTLSSYKNYLRIIDKPSLKDTTVIIEFEDNGIEPLFAQIEESFKNIGRDTELLLKQSDVDELRADIYDRLKQINDKTKDLRNLWLQAKI